MTSPLSKSSDLRPGRTPIQSEFEPDAEWIDRTRKEIEAGLRSMVDVAKETHSRGLQETQDPKKREAIENDLKATMNDIIKLASEQLMEAIDRQRQELRWAAGHTVEAGWSDALVKEQQAILDDIKRKGSMRSQERPNITADDPRRENEDPVVLAEDDDRDIPTQRASDFAGATQQPNGARRDATTGYSASGRGHISPSQYVQEPEEISTFSEVSYPAQAGVSRKPSASSLSKSKPIPQIWHPFPEDTGGTSRTFAYANSPTQSFIAPNRRGKSRRNSSVSTRSRESTQLLPPSPVNSRVDARYQQDSDEYRIQQERTGVPAIDAHWAPYARDNDRQPEWTSEVRHQGSMSDIRAQHLDGRNLPPTPVTSFGISTSPDRRRNPQSGEFETRRPGGEERTGIPIPTLNASTSRIQSFPQGSPVVTRYIPAEVIRAGFRPTEPSEEQYDFPASTSYSDSSPQYEWSGPRPLQPQQSPISRPRRSFPQGESPLQRQSSPVIHRSGHSPSDSPLSSRGIRGSNPSSEAARRVISKQSFNMEDSTRQTQSSPVTSRPGSIPIPAPRYGSSPSQDYFDAPRSRRAKRSLTSEKSVTSEDSPYTGHYRSVLNGPPTPQDPLEGAQYFSGTSPGLSSFNRRSSNDNFRQPHLSSPSTRGWAGPPIVYAPQVVRRGSGSSRRSSLRSPSVGSEHWTSRMEPELYGPTMETYNEQSGQSSDNYSDNSDWEDSAFDVEALEQRRAQLEKDESTAKWADQVSAREEKARKQAEQAQRKVDEARRKEEESKKKEEDVRRKEEEIKQKEEEAKRKEEEARRREEEAERTRKEAVRREEEAKRREEDIKKREAELKRREQEEINRKEEEARRKEEELRKKEEELRKREEDLNRREAAAAEMKRLEDEKLKAEQEAHLKRMQDIEVIEALELEQVETRAWEEYVQEQTILEAKIKQDNARKQQLEAERRQCEQRKASQPQDHATKEAKARDKFLRDLAAKKQTEAAKQEEALRQEQEQRQKEEAERRRLQLEAQRRREEEAKREEHERAEQQYRQRADEALQRADEARRKAEEKRRQDSTGNSSESPGPSPATPQSNPWSFPHRNGTANSSSTNRHSTSSSSSTSTGSAWSSTTSNSSRTSSAASSGAKSTSSPRRAGTSSGTTPTPSNPTSMSQSDWERFQAEQARIQQERFREEQERLERERQTKSLKAMSRDDMIRVLDEHDRRWAKLPTMDVLSWDSFPWPTLKPPTDPDDMTYVAISSYVLSPVVSSDKSDKDRVKEHIRRWHPDRFETKLLPKVREADQEKVKEGAGVVVRYLNQLLTSRSNAGLFS